MTKPTDFDPFAGGELAASSPTTEPQQEIWLAATLGGDIANLAYNESLILRLAGPLDVTALGLALRDLVARHDALRATFSADGESFCVEAKGRVELEGEDLAALPPQHRAERLQALHRLEVTTPFDLVRGPLFRARLLKLGPQEHELVLTGHHLVCDGWSAWVIVSELRTLYGARLAGVPADLEPAAQFTDYARKAGEASHGAAVAAAERFWLGLLGDRPPVLDLPTDRPRALERNPAAARIDLRLDAKLVEGLRALTKRHGISMVGILVAAFDAFLYRLTGQSDFVLAMPAGGQLAADMPSLVGHCVNTLPLRMTFDPTAPFLDHAKAVKRAILDGFDNQQLSFGSLIKKLNLPRDPSRVPLAPVIFNVDQRFELDAFGAATVAFETNPRVADNFELFINGTESGSSLVLETTYNTALFERATVLRWLDELTVLMQGVVANPEQAVGELPILPEAERRQQVETWNATATSLPPEATVLELVEGQARRTPDAIAVRDARQSLTYRELDENANALAHALLELGVAPEECVGVAVERSARMLVALLAVWKAGGAYLPLDPEYPAARLEYVAQDVTLRVLITDSASASVLDRPDIKRVWLDQPMAPRGQPPSRRPRARHLAYVLHTSGSTGQPKGVPVEQRSFVNLLHALRQWPGMQPNDVLVAVTTLSFDMAGVELFLPLVAGAQVVVASRETAMDARALGELIASSGGTVVQATPVTWRMLVEADWQGPAVTAFTGGEPLARDLAAALLGRVRSLYNLYGPTETTVYSTGTRIESPDTITIGRPLANTTAYILDDRRRLLPIGARGELYLGGLGLARGYWHRPDLTAERFLPDPIRPGPDAVLYRTGDVARFDATGNIVYEGRNDTQVKIRGFRIELGEIEVALARQPRVRQCVVVLKEVFPSDFRLVAYVVGQDEKLDPAALQNGLREALPPYMIPQHIVQLGALPLTPNGKVDRKALPLPELGLAPGSTGVGPRTPTERRLAEIWCDVLHLAQVGVDASFFELGGHSMLAVRMMNRIREAFGVELPLKLVFQAQTIEGLALRIDAALLQEPGSPAGGGGTPVEEVEF
jgi:amino acid adenylation domain-containing protein